MWMSVWGGVLLLRTQGVIFLPKKPKAFKHTPWLQFFRPDAVSHVTANKTPSSGQMALSPQPHLRRWDGQSTRCSSLGLCEHGLDKQRALSMFHSDSTPLHTSLPQLPFEPQVQTEQEMSTATVVGGG